MSKKLAMKLKEIVKDKFKDAVKEARKTPGKQAYIEGAKKVGELLGLGTVALQLRVDPNGSKIASFTHTDKEDVEVKNEETNETVVFVVETDVEMVTTDRGGRISLHMVNSNDDAHALAELAAPKS